MRRQHAQLQSETAALIDMNRELFSASESASSRLSARAAADQQYFYKLQIAHLPLPPPRISHTEKCVFNLGCSTTFKTHMVTELLPRMVRRGKKWLIMDNAAWHHANNDEIVAVCRLFGVVLIWLAPYHPQANPCENLFGNVKRNLQDYRDELDILSTVPRARLLKRIFRDSARLGKCKRWVGRCGYYAGLS